MLSNVTVSTEAWDQFVRQQARGHVLQLSSYGTLKSAFGWDATRIAVADDGELVAGTQLLFRRFPLGISKMAYLPPDGPYYQTEAQATFLWGLIDSHIREKRASFLKWEPGIFDASTPLPDFAARGFNLTDQTIQPPNTIMLDISDDEEAIMGRMNQGTRRKIRKSLKSDIHYYEAAPADVHKFTDMMLVTGDRNEFGVHEPAYYQLAYDLSVPQGDATLILAEHGGDVLAGIMVYAVNQTAWYLYGASSNEKRNLMAAYGVQWEAILWAKARGCLRYDMWGIPDETENTLEADFTERSDGLWGVYGFKRGWGGAVVRSAGAYDKVYNPLLYKGYQTALALRGG